MCISLTCILNINMLNAVLYPFIDKVFFCECFSSRDEEIQVANLKTVNFK
jgi:hypothetical protein